jgi:hypothetical protein
MLRLALASLLFVVSSAPVRSAEKPAEQWLLVTAPAYRDSVQPLADYRKFEGFDVTVVQTTDVLAAKEILASDARKLRDKVTQLCRDHRGATYVLLVGAVESSGEAEPETKVLPPLKGIVSRMKNQPTDHGYGSPDADFVPTAMVGRLPARTVEEARQMVEKVLAFERDRRPGEWRRKLTILAGAPEFSPAVDALVERLVMSRFDKLDPAWSGKGIASASSSRFGVPASAIHERALEYVQGGQLLTLYLGHSNAEGFWAGRTRFLDRNDWRKLAIARGPGLFATFGCFGCQLAGADGEGYGVVAFRNPRGPVAVIGSHGLCFAAMAHLGADGLFDSLLTGTPPERLGQCWHQVQQSVGTGEINPVMFRLLDAADGDTNIPVATQRREHLEMFLLLGDPALKLPTIPADVKLRSSGTVSAGKTLTVRGEVSARLEGAMVRLTLERPLASEPADLQVVPKEPDTERAKIMLANHERANRFVLLSRDATVKSGRFEATFTLPDPLPWPRVQLRAYAATDKQEGIGVLAVPIQP